MYGYHKAIAILALLLPSVLMAQQGGTVQGPPPIPVVGCTVTGTTDTIGTASANCPNRVTDDTHLMPIILANTGGGGVTETVPTATSLGNSAAGIIIRCQTIPAATCTVNFTTWLVNSAACAPASTSPCSQILLSSNQQLVTTVNKLGGSWDAQVTGITNGSATSAQVPVTCAPSASLPFSPLPQVFVTDFFIQLTQNCTITSVTGPFTAGSEIVITTINNGGFTLGFPANFINTPPIQTGVNAYNAMTFQYCGSVGTVACPAGDWNNTDIGPAGALPTLDAVLNPVNNASFTFPATEGLTVAGTQPASAATGTNAGALETITTPAGGTGSTNAGGSGGDVVVNLGAGGTSTSGVNARAGNVIVNPGAYGTGGTGPGFPNLNPPNAPLQIQSNNIFPFGGSTFPMDPSSGFIARNTASTSGNTANRWSPTIGMTAHMQENGVDREVQAGMLLYPGKPSANNMIINNGNNPDITWLLQIPQIQSGWSGNFHLCFMQGGACISTVNGGGSVGGAAYFWSAGAQTIIGVDPSVNTANSNIVLQTVAAGGVGSMDVEFHGHGQSGTFAASMGDDNQGTNGTWVYASEMNNSSGGNIADGTLVKAGTADSVTPILHTDTPTNLIVGVVVVRGGGNCASATKCHVAWGGQLNGIIKMGTASCAIGNAVIPDTTTDGEVKCVAAGSATAGQILGIAMSAQATPGNTVDVAIRIH